MPSCKLNASEMILFEKLRKSAKQMFANNIDELGACSIMEHKIRIENNNQSPIYTPPYRKSEAERNYLKDEINSMLKAGIIRKSRSPWSSPVVVVPKKGGKKRLCIDYRKLNNVTITEKWPIPNILDILDRFKGSTWFSALDLKSGYWQIKMDPDSIEKTAFTTPDGHYEFLRLPFGLKNAPADFSRIMNIVLGDLPFVEVYLDDITVHSTTLEQHIENLKVVFKRLKEANLKINAEKCSWCAKSIKVLGHIVSKDQVMMDPEKIAAIKEREPPKNLKQLQSFLGLCNYYRRFIKDFSKIAQPMFSLCIKNVKFEWSKECHESFDQLKSSLVSYPILRLADVSKDFKLYTDASGYAIGAILAQVDEKNQEYVVAYASRLMTKTEINYGITEKECLAVIYGIKQFRNYLYGTKFKVITDHSALHWLKNIKMPSSRLTRWSIYIQEFDCEIIHRKGSHHANVDAISRPVFAIELVNQTTDKEDEDEACKNLDPWEDDSLLYYLKFGRFIRGSSKKQIKRIHRVASKFLINNEKLYYKKEKDILVEIPKIDERRGIIEKAHSLGHFQVDSTYNALKDKYYWKRMIDQIKYVIKQCVICHRNNKTIVKYHPALATSIKQLFDRVSIDLVLGLKETSDGFVGIVVMIEALSKYPWAKPIRTKTAEEIAGHVFEFICIFGPFKELLSDQGKEFCNQILEKLKNNVGFEHIVTSAYNPRTNGMTERLNQTIIESLRKHSENNPEEWPKHLNFVLMAYRTRVHSVTNYTPFELMFGRKMNQFENWTSSNEDEVSAILNRTQEIKEMFENTHSSALANIKKNQEKQIIIQNKAHNTESEKIPIGTTVYLKCEGLLSKLEPRFKGPYKITGHTSRGNYKVQDALGNAISESFPRQKIKVVIDNELLPEQSLEIEKIIKHKIVDNNWFYLVKWADMPAKESSWIPESHFNSKLIINKYKETLGNQIQLRQRKPRKINMVSNLVILLLWCLFVPICTHPPNATIKNTTSKSTPTMSVTTKKSVKQTSYSKSTEKMNNPVDDLIKGFATINSTFKACTKDLEKNLVNINTMCVEQRNHDNSSLEIYLEEAFMPITKAQEICMYWAKCTMKYMIADYNAQ